MKVLFLGCHCDDIELGCGATISKYKNEWDISCVCLSSCGPFGKLEQIKEQSILALNYLGASDIHYLNYPTNDFWIHRQAIWEDLHKLELKFQPDLVISQVADEHQDHSILYSETIRNFKSKNILLYKPSLVYGMSHSWNWIEKINKNHLLEKIKASSYFLSYLDKNYFDPNIIEAQARIMGINSGVEYAEAYQVYRIVKI